jgi:phosphopantothenoylcysteine decarboxylase/phosphopantothenate--cysteine ligase
VSGGIAAYKACEIVRRLREAGCDVHVILTRHAQELIPALTLQVLSGNRAITGQFERIESPDIEHVELARRAELLLVAPATANAIGKFAAGIADDFLSTFFTATEAPTLLAPAMNSRMWRHPPVEDNLARLRELGVEVVGPEEGELACGESGPGRLAGVGTIVARALEILGAPAAGDLQGLRVLVTAGPTVEDLDPVRFLSNRSTGRMGFAMAREAALRGAEVVLVHGPTTLSPPPGCRAVPVRSAVEMRDAVMQALEGTDVFVAAAAVADYRFASPSPQKIHKEGESLRLELVRTPDVLAEVSAAPAERTLVGFAAETERMEESARRKLEAKGLDLIVANPVGREGAGFASETNEAVLLDRDGGREEVARTSKDDLARRVWDRVVALRGEGR